MFSQIDQIGWRTPWKFSRDSDSISYELYDFFCKYLVSHLLEFLKILP